MSSPSLVLYGRDGCHLCEEALNLIIGLRSEGLVFELCEVDIESDHELHRTFLERIPVVEVDGVEVAELEINAADVRDAIKRAATMAPDDSNS